MPPDFPCYYDVVGKDYACDKNTASTLTTLRKYLEGTLALARAGGAYRTDAEYKGARAPPQPPPQMMRSVSTPWSASRKTRNSRRLVQAPGPEERGRPSPRPCPVGPESSAGSGGYNQLDPAVSKAPFTVDEVRTILVEHHKRGNRWARSRRCCRAARTTP